jgi:hypothetical protein
MRKSTNIVMFLVLMNATALFLTASGVGADLGIAPQTGGGQGVESVNSALNPDNVNPGGGAGGTLFGLFTSAATIFKDVAVMATVGGPLMLANLGVPAFVVTFVFAPMYLIVGADALYLYTGRDV